MALVIPDQRSNWIVTLNNLSGGLSGRSTIAVGTLNDSPLTQTIVNRVANLFRDNLAPLFDTSWLMGPVHVVEGTASTPKVWDDTGTEAGTHATVACCSPAVAVIVSKQTGLSGRRHRGRLYLPGVPESEVDEAGSLTGGWVNTVQSAFDTLQANLVADAAVNSLDLFHDELTPGASQPDTITSFRVRTIVGTMRPRQRR